MNTFNDQVSATVGQDKPMHEALDVYKAKTGHYQDTLIAARNKRAMDQSASTVMPFGPLRSGR